MTSIAAMDNLIAALYPHIHEYLFGESINAPESLQPSEDYANIHDFVDSFATLFSLYPCCGVVAAATQAPLPRKASLYIYPSLRTTPTPDGFDAQVKKCFAQFVEACVAQNSNPDASAGGKLSRPAQRFIIDSYTLCYPAMRQRVIEDEPNWDVFFEPPQPDAEDAKHSRDNLNVAEGLARLTTLLKQFVETIIEREAGLEASDTLQFHQLCLAIVGEMEKRALRRYIGRYLYPGGVDYLLSQFFCVPIALSKLLSLPASLLPAFRHRSPIVIVEPPLAARRFEAILTPEHLRKCLEEPGEEKSRCRIDWEEVARAFAIEKNFGQGTEWDAEKRVVSTAGPVVPHPEVVLTQYLLNVEKPDDDDSGELNAYYIACSSTPCYASIMYAGAVNDAREKLKCHLTMRTEDPASCRLAWAQPWILPEDTVPEVVSEMKDELMRELSWLIYEWSMERALEGPPGEISDSEFQ